MSVLPELEPMFNPWNEYLDYLYDLYLKSIVNGNLLFDNVPVKSQYRPEYKGKGFSFWHVISEGSDEADRIPDMRRCERIGWIAWLITHAKNDDNLSWWENKRGGNTHIVIWHEAENYVVILAKRRRYYLIKTAYVVQSENKSAKFRRERDEFWQDKKG